MFGFNKSILLAQLALERLPCKVEDHGKHDGVREVHRQRRATRRQPDEHTRDEEIEQSGNECELNEHFCFKRRKILGVCSKEIVEYVF